MLNVSGGICAGCGICTRVCPTGAISLDAGIAHIDQDKCVNCYQCIQACPRGAIATVGSDFKPSRTVSPVWELRNSFQSLQAEIQMAVRRLKSLEQRKAARRK